MKISVPDFAEIFELIVQRCHMVSAILVKIGSGNGLYPAWCQVIVWTNDDLLSTGPLARNLLQYDSKYHTSALCHVYKGCVQAQHDMLCGYNFWASIQFKYAVLPV